MGYFSFLLLAVVVVWAAVAMAHLYVPGFIELAPSKPNKALCEERVSPARLPATWQSPEPMHPPPSRPLHSRRIPPFCNASELIEEVK